MSAREMSIASKAVDFAGQTAGAHSAATAVEVLEERYRKLSAALKDAVGSIQGVITALDEAVKQTEATKDDKGYGNLWFLGLYNEGYKEALNKYKADVREMLAEQEEYAKKRIDIEREVADAEEGYGVLHGAALNARQAVFSRAYDAMGDEMRRFVEVGKFSAGAFAKVVAQQVKTELIGLAARASVWAIYETAMGFRDMAMGLPTAALHFKSAAEFGAVAGASLVGAAGIQGAFFGGTHKESSKGSGSGAAHLGNTPLTTGPEGGAPSQTTQNITVHIYNPLSEQNWQKIVEDSIIPAINGASEKNISVAVKTI